ncbi:hypothetical protein DFJ63DRAFT_312893 [Scheffersomyces coipomensis]|uniref:uncharacterized protein n=1 Tax=Scheffersomyces coipomensis TaxID=1788519 RepID=UPI00315D4E2A
MSDISISFYDDTYIETFFNKIFPKFPYDLIVNILQFLSIPEILVLQSLIEDNYVKRIRINQIKKHRLSIICDSIDFDEEIDKKFLQIKQMFQTIVRLTKSDPHNIIPVDITFFCESMVIDCLDDWLDNATNFDIVLILYRCHCFELQNYKKSSMITKIYVEHSACESSQDFRLDFSIYSNLKEIEYCCGYLKSLNLDSSFETLTSLAIPDIYSQEYLSRFINLKHLKIEFQEDFHIKKLPRNILTLWLEGLYVNSDIIIQSSDDWPKNLNSLSIIMGANFRSESISSYKLPSNLESLTINSVEVSNIFPEFPSLLRDLELQSHSKNPLYFSSILEMGYRKLVLDGFIPVDDSISSLKVAQGLEELSFVFPSCSFSLDSIDFEGAKSTLRSLSLAFKNYQCSFTRVNFGEFSKLKSIKLEGCNIELENLILPTCLNELEIEFDHFTSIDDNCPLFSNPYIYSRLQSLKFSSCQVGFISPNVSLPINLRTLFIPHCNDVRFLSNVINHTSLNHFGIWKLTSFEIFDDLEIFNTEGSSNFTTNINKLEFEIYCTPFTDSIIENFYNQIESTFRKKIANRKVCEKLRSYQILDLVPKFD